MGEDYREIDPLPPQHQKLEEDQERDLIDTTGV